MKKISSTKLNFTNKNNLNLNNNTSKLSRLNNENLSIKDLVGSSNDNINIQQTSSLLGIASDILSLATFGIVTDEDIFSIFRDNNIDNLFNYSRDIKKIETEGFFLFITLDDGYTYTFTKKNDSIILIGISDEDGHNFSFGRDGIDSLYDTIPAHDRLGDDEDIESIKLTETGLIVELDNVEYLIDNNTKKVVRFDNGFFGPTSIEKIDYYIDELCEQWSESLRDGYKTKEELKDTYLLASDNIKSILVKSNTIEIEFNSGCYLFIEEDMNGKSYYRIQRNSNVFYNSIPITEYEE